MKVKIKVKSELKVKLVCLITRAHILECYLGGWWLNAGQQDAMVASWFETRPGSQDLITAKGIATQLLIYQTVTVILQPSNFICYIAKYISFLKF